MIQIIASALTNSGYFASSLVR